MDVRMWHFMPVPGRNGPMMSNEMHSKGMWKTGGLYMGTLHVPRLLNFKHLSQLLINCLMSFIIPD